MGLKEAPDGRGVSEISPANGLGALETAKWVAEQVSRSSAYQDFVEILRQRFPWRFKLPAATLERDYLRIVDHHLTKLLPRMLPCIESGVQRVFDFGCGSGGSAIALALTYPHLSFCGTDIDPDEIFVARERAQLYGVAD